MVALTSNAFAVVVTKDIQAAKDNQEIGDWNKERGHEGREQRVLWMR